MKLHCNTEPLRNALETLRPLFSGRSTLPVLACVKLHAEGDLLTISASDIDNACSITIPVETKQEGEAIVSGQRLLNALKASRGDCDITAAKSLTYSAGPTKATLGLSTDPWPDAGVKIEGKPITISGEELATALKKVIPCISHDTSRPTLQGVHFEESDGRLRLVSATGYMLATTVTSAKCSDADVILTETACNLLASITGEAKLSLSENSFQCETESMFLRGAVIAGTFPNWKSLIAGDKERNVKIALSKAEFLEALRYASSLGVVGGIRLVKAEIIDGEMNLSSHHEEDVANRIVKVAVVGDIHAFHFNADYMAAILSAIDSDEVSLLMIDRTSAMMVRENDTVVVLMPNRIE
jgi:DNA polymerase III subunit beta